MMMLVLFKSILFGALSGPALELRHRVMDAKPFTDLIKDRHGQQTDDWRQVNCHGHEQDLLVAADRPHNFRRSVVRLKQRQKTRPPRLGPFKHACFDEEWADAGCVNAGAP